MEQLENMTMSQLREEAKARGLKGVSTAKKQELVEMILADRAQRKEEKVTEKQAPMGKKAPLGKQAEVSVKGETHKAENDAGERRTPGDRQGNGNKPANGYRERPQGHAGHGNRPVAEHHGVQRAANQATEDTARPRQAAPVAEDTARPRQANPVAEDTARPRQAAQATEDAARPRQANMVAEDTVRPRQANMVAEDTARQRQANMVAEDAARPRQATPATEGAAVPRQENPEQEGAPAAHYTKEQLALAEINRISVSELCRLDSGETREGILEVMPEFGFIRSDNFLSGPNDVYVSMAQVKRFGLRTGDIICGNMKIKTQNEKFVALLYIKSVNGIPIENFRRRKSFEELTPIFPNERIHLETSGCSLSMRMVDLISPIGKGQRGMIVSQPKAGKTTLLKQIAKSITTNHKEMNLIILLIDERPEEVTDIKESIEGEKVRVIYSTFDELPEKHKKVSEMVIEHAKRLVELGEDVVILLDSITRLARAYNLTVTASGRTLSGGLDPAALYMPKKFFGAARNMREGGSLTVLATALVETGSRMDDVVFEEFKGTGNMELQLDRNLSERRIFPAIDLLKSSTRRDDLLLTHEEQEAVAVMRRMFSGARSEENLENIIRTFQNTKNNRDFVEIIRKNTQEKR